MLMWLAGSLKPSSAAYGLSQLGVIVIRNGIRLLISIKSRSVSSSNRFYCISLE